MIIRINTPLTHECVKGLRAGNMVEITGYVYTARDAAHQKLMELIHAGKELPFEIKDQIVYYVGPCPAPEGKMIGSAGPTTSGRMDKYAPKLIELGMTGMIGKGQRSAAVVEAMQKHGAVYFGAIGGAGALISKCIKKSELIAFPELGTEAVRKLTVEEFPAVVVIDAYGSNLYDIGRKQYALEL